MPGAVGMLDWTDAALGDPARDFVTLVTFAGWPFARPVRSYAVPVDRAFEDRLRLLARLLSMVWLVDARGSGVAKHVAWVARAFSR